MSTGLLAQRGNLLAHLTHLALFRIHFRLAAIDHHARFELLLQIDERRLVARVQFHSERLRVALTVDCEFDGVIAGKNGWTAAATAEESGAGETTAAGNGRVAQVPNEAVHSGSGRRRL